LVHAAHFKELFYNCKDKNIDQIKNATPEQPKCHFTKFNHFFNPQSVCRTPFGVNFSGALLKQACSSIFSQ